MQPIKCSAVLLCSADSIYPTDVARSMSVCLLGAPVSSAKTLNRSRCRLRADSRGPKEPCKRVRCGCTLASSPGIICAMAGMLALATITVATCTIINARKYSHV